MQLNIEFDHTAGNIYEAIGLTKDRGRTLHSELAIMGFHQGTSPSRLIESVVETYSDAEMALALMYVGEWLP